MNRRHIALGPFIVVMTIMTGCVLPDRGIIIVDENVQNKHPVRFVEPTPVTNEAANLCLKVLAEQDMPTQICQPSDPTVVLPHFLDPLYLDADNTYPYRFCSCDSGKVDTLKFPAVPLYVEDRADNIDEGLDPIYAALQLDLRPDESQPQNTVEYESYVNPSAALEPAELEYAPPARPNEAAGRALRVINLGFSEDQIDLCNDVGTVPLARGFHTLRVIVTDAPWFTPPPPEKMPNQLQVQQAGVPDLAEGATYDTVTYTFHCGDRTDPYCENQCEAPQP